MLLLVLALAALAFSAPAASAEVGHRYGGQITEAPPATSFAQPWGLTFDGAGHLYAADAAAEQIDVFSPANVFSSQFSEGFTPSGKGYVRSVAVNDKTGVVYVGVSEPEAVLVYKPEGAGKYKLLQKQPFGSFVYVAVDSSSGPHSGGVYVITAGFGHNEVQFVKTNGTGELEGTGTELTPPEEGFSLVSTKEQQGGLTVDNVTGELYIANPGNKTVDEYTSEGEPLLAKLTLAGSFEPVAVAVNEETEEIYVLNAANGTVDEFSSSGEHIGTTADTEKEAGKPEPFKEPLGVAVQNAAGAAKGDVYVSDGAAKAIDVFGPDILVPAVVTGSASGVTGTTATLSGTVNPEGVEVKDCHFDYGTTAAYGQTAACEQIVGSGSGEVAVTAKVAGLAPGTTYHFRLQAENANHAPNIGADATLETLRLPLIAGASAVNLTASTADLTATVNPEGFPVTSCQFEYGTSTSYGLIGPCAQSEPQIGAGTEPVPVSAHLSGLDANIEYHWRLVAGNGNGSSASADHTFVYPTTGAELPDHRAYEMATPPQKNGALLGDVFSGFAVSVSETGSRVIMASIQCFAGSESCTGFRATNGEPFEFTRTPAGWVTSALAPPATQFRENSFWSASADAGTALFSMPTGPAEEDEWYARSPTGSFLPIGPAKPPGQTGTGSFTESHLSTSDLSHLVWNLEETTYWPGDETTGASSLYEYVATGNKEPFLVGVSNDGQLKSNVEAELISTCATGVGVQLGSSIGQAWNALSQDGRTVYFAAKGHDGGFGCPSSAPAPPVEELFARVDGDLPDAHTIAISQPKAPATLASTPADENCTTAECLKDITEEANWRDGLFSGASQDGSKVFFVDPQKLTDQGTEGVGHPAAGRGCPESSEDCNLYLYDFGQPVGHNLIDVSAPDTTGEIPHVLGVVATSADGSHVYFVARGKLARNRSALGREAAAGEINLYAFDAHTRHTAFVAAVPGSDEFNWTHGTRHENVTPDGRFLVFESHGALTPDATGGEGATQVYRYDAASEQLVRVSIGNDGFNDNGNAGTGNATIVPSGEGAPSVGPARGDLTMSHDGSYVFFQSPVGLTPHALNDSSLAGGGFAQNVYEWHEGHVYLISDGRDASSAKTPCESRGEGHVTSVVCLLGTDATGSNVFFTTADQLVPSDTDTQVDTYDARICDPAGGNPCIASEPRQLPPCGGEACHGIPGATPSSLTPGSASFNGEGNITPPHSAVNRSLTNAQKLAKALKACRAKHNKHRRRVCEAQARKQYSTHKAKRSTHGKKSN